MRGFVDSMTAREGHDGVLSMTLFHGFPHGDVADLGARMLVVTDDRPDYGAAVAAAFASRLWEIREGIALDYLTVDAALDEGTSAAAGPVVIADVSDNPGCGAAGDSTFILRRLMERRIEGAVVATIWDPVAVRICFDAGEGTTLRLRIGGKCGPDSGDPIDLPVTIMRVIADATQTFNGFRTPMGEAVWVRGRGIDVILNSKRFQTAHPNMLSQFGIDPASRRILVVKSTQHFHAGFAPIAARILYAAAKGSSNPDTKAIRYRKGSTKLWPSSGDPNPIGWP